jgi:tetrahydromethanopterin S-methyltransferase subunit G
VPEAANSSNPRRSERESRAQRSTPTTASEEASGAGNYRAVTQDKLGQALSDLLENPLVTGAIGRAWGAREKAAQAQELWMGALNIPSAADIERLTRRLRSVSQRLEGVEDGVQRLGRSIVQSSGIEARLERIDTRLDAIAEELRELHEAVVAREGSSAHAPAGAASASRSGSATAARSRARAKR